MCVGHEWVVEKYQHEENYKVLSAHMLCLLLQQTFLITRVLLIQIGITFNWPNVDCKWISREYCLPGNMTIIE